MKKSCDGSKCLALDLDIRELDLDIYALKKLYKLYNTAIHDALYIPLSFRVNQTNQLPKPFFVSSSVRLKSINPPIHTIISPNT